MEVDYEDRVFIKEVGNRAVKVLRTRNARLWSEFKKRCEENGERPETVLGMYLYRFAKSVVDEDGSFAEELLGTTVKLAALNKRSDLVEVLDQLVAIKEKLKTSESSTIDRLIEKLIETEIAKTALSPADVIASKQESKIVIDENLLSSLTADQLDALEKLVKKVKEEKIKSVSKTSEEIEEIVGGADEEVEKEGDEHYEYTENDNRDSERVEKLAERN